MRSPAFFVIGIWLACCGVQACQATADAEPTTPNPTTTSTSAAPPEVGLATATTGRLPLRRQTYGVVRAHRRADILARRGGPLEQSPTEGRYYAAGDTLLRIISVEKS